MKNNALSGEREGAALTTKEEEELTRPETVSTFYFFTAIKYFSLKFNYPKYKTIKGFQQLHVRLLNSQQANVNLLQYHEG